MTILNRFKQHPKKKSIYAVTGGKMLGELLVYITTDNNEYKFLSVPLMKNRIIPAEKFEFGLKEKIVEYVDTLPGSVYKVCVAQYSKNVEDNNITV